MRDETNANRSTFLHAFVIALLACQGEALAQCATARIFASVGLAKFGQAQLEIDASLSDNAGHEIGRFWDSADSSASNNFDGECPSNDAWWTTTMEGHRGIYGALTGSNCAQPGCPTNEMTLVVEDYGPGGPDEAYFANFIAFRVDETPPDPRWYDFARAGGSSVLPMLEFPKPRISYFAFSGPQCEVELNVDDIADRVHAVRTPGLDEPLPASEVVKSYDLMIALGPEDPGRERSLWTLVSQHPYDDSGLQGVFASLPACQEPWWLAVGLTFHGGAGPDVPSALVGMSTRLNIPSWYQGGPPVHAGAIPDGHFIPGEPLRIAKAVAPGGETELTLSWGPSCNSADPPGAFIYQGYIGNWTSHIPVSCDTLQNPLVPPDGDLYYLVVPAAGFEPFITLPTEGGYGFGRPPSLWGCLPWNFPICSQ